MRSRLDLNGAWLLAAALTVTACASPPVPASDAPAQAPASPATAGAEVRAGSLPLPATTHLVVFLTIDQLRTDYLTEKFTSQLTGGLGRLIRGGAFFVNGVHDHATTETAPGHASTLSGRFPRSTNIVRNNAGVNTPDAPMIGGGGPGASPARFRGTTLVDWLVAKDARTRVLSVSRKDRSAILPIGRSKQPVYWYATDGRFTTSTWYADTLPTWVRRFNDRQLPQRTAGRTWSLLLPESAYPEPDSVPEENHGRDFTFPHRHPTDPAAAARSLASFPAMDEITLAFALDGVNALDLGRGPQTDLLSVSLSTTDAVGHAYGPDSREIRDQMVRVDRMLGTFLDSLYAMRDSTRIVIALTSDHGVAPIAALHFGSTAAGTTRIDTMVARYKRTLAARGVDSATFDFEPGLLFVNRQSIDRAGLSPDSVLRAFAADARRVPRVLRADAMTDLARADTVNDVLARRWLHAIPPDLNVGVVVTLEPYVYWGAGLGASHGTPHDYDARVPILFHGDEFQPGRYEDVARVVDMAPTLATVLGVTPLERLDGRALMRAIRAR